jgi:hypothetical protein
MKTSLNMRKSLKYDDNEGIFKYDENKDVLYCLMCSI